MPTRSKPKPSRATSLGPVVTIRHGWRITIHRVKLGYRGEAVEIDPPAPPGRVKILATHPHVGKGAQRRAMDDICTQVDIEVVLREDKKCAK